MAAFIIYAIRWAATLTLLYSFYRLLLKRETFHLFPISALDLSLDYDHVRRQFTADQYKNMSLFNASAQYKLKRLVLRLELDNLLNQRNYAYTIFNGINTYTYNYALCSRTIMFHATFKL